ncbi:tRNA lysidine(34) synthetase TilS [Corynebacterium comes]|uniref:tRNA(Ile)-lysidine synthase n=1 Tax=Corynebacterium comes TaxID=2675218 RepID=A0A6B8VJM0_9CORY|nr:tRNA lysidine(34) synthetase TilS [Corynebacterium comes]QGU05562.1 tRNA(Ile)-lysidine synthase [Corynebacterium comes]
MRYPRVSPRFLACRVAVRPFLTSEPVIVGLSGGADSLALVAAAVAEGQAVQAVAVDHQLQPGSAEVAEKACEQAEQLGAGAQLRTVTVEEAGSLEANARQARYAALFGAGKGDVWVAHTREDQAETLLLGALRGNPAGMSPRAGRLVRPFLKIRRTDTLGACAELDLDPWHDPHNDDPAFRRVAVRRQFIPQLGELIGGSAVEPLAQAADRIAADNALLEELAGPPTENCAELAAQAGPLRRRRIAAWLRERDVGVTAASISAIEALCTDWRGQGGVAVGRTATGRLEVRRVDGRLTLFPAG